MLATVPPAGTSTLVSVLARLEAQGSGDAGIKIAAESAADRIASATKTERRGVRIRENLERDVGNEAEVGNVAFVVNIKQRTVLWSRGFQQTEGTIRVRALRAVVDTVKGLVDRVVDTGHVVAVTASTAITASLVLRLVLATVTRIAVAIVVAVGSIASVDAFTSGGRCNVRVAGDVSGGEMSRINSLQERAIESSNESMVVLAVSHIRALELVEENVLSIVERVNNELVCAPVRRDRVLLEVRAVNNLVEVVIAVGRTPVLPVVSSIEVGDVAKSLRAFLAERTVVLATVGEVEVAVLPTWSALELALTTPVVAGLTVAGAHPSEVELIELSLSHERTAIVGLITRVVESSLATVGPVRISVIAGINAVANAEVALASRRVAEAFRPVPRVEAVEGIALNTLAFRAASAVVEDVRLATRQGVGVAVLPAIIGVTNEVALTGVGISGVVDAGDPCFDGVGMEVRAREDVAVTSQVVIRRE